MREIEVRWFHDHFLMLEEWLIDGYNLLHSASSHENKKQGVFREALFELLASFASSEDRKVLMVLDGQGNDQEFGAYQTKNFAVIYSNALTADSVIERMLCGKKGAVSFRVVTKDRAVCRMARGLGARVTEPKEFMALLNAGRKETDQILFSEKIKSHGFSRPFEEKLKNLSEKIDPQPKNKTKE